MQAVEFLTGPFLLYVGVFTRLADGVEIAVHQLQNLQLLANFFSE